MKLFSLEHALILSILFYSSSLFASDQNCESIVNDFPGTYTLVKRTLLDGTVLSGSKVQGTTIFTKNGFRVTAVAIKSDKDTFSVAVQTRYSLSSTQFSDKLTALVLQEGTSPIVYQFDHPKSSVPVVCKKGELIINNPPNDPLSTLIFTQTSMTAVLNKGADSGAVGVWKKVN